MDQTHHVERLFEEVAATMQLKFHGWEQDLPHHGERGGIRERRVATFLRSMRIIPYSRANRSTPPLRSSRLSPQVQGNNRTEPFMSVWKRLRKSNRCTVA
jgi:hypothetical protein